MRSRINRLPLVVVRKRPTFDVLPSDTSWLFEPTTSVHQFGGGVVRRYRRSHGSHRNAANSSQRARLAAGALLGAQGPLSFGAQRWRDLCSHILHRLGRFSRTSYRRFWPRIVCDGPAFLRDRKWDSGAVRKPCSAASTTQCIAQEYDGGAVDWYTFDRASATASTGTPAPPPSPTTRSAMAAPLALASLNRACRDHRPDVSAALTTVAFDQSGPRWLGISDLIAEPEGPTFISYKVARSLF